MPVFPGSFTRIVMSKYLIDIDRGFIRVGRLGRKPVIHPRPGTGNISNCSSVHLIPAEHPDCFKLLGRYLSYTKAQTVVIEHLFGVDRREFTTGPDRYSLKVKTALELVKALAETSLPEIIIVTRSPLILTLSPVLRSARQRIKVRMLIEFIDEKLNRRWFPGMASPEARLIAARGLRNCGIKTGLSVIPMSRLSDSEKDCALYFKNLKELKLPVRLEKPGRPENILISQHTPPVGSARIVGLFQPLYLLFRHGHPSSFRQPKEGVPLFTPVKKQYAGKRGEQPKTSSSPKLEDSAEDEKQAA